ncbi:MAG: MDR family MFS transporter [Chloroflexi bacterium]|nr:MDR family MFS transporter [Chloroflexota bacterium]
MSSGTASGTMGMRSLPRRQLIITLIGVLLAMFMSSLDQTIVATAMPHIISDLGGFSQYTWITTIYIITSAVAIPITGKLTDMYGRRYFYITGLIIFTLSSLSCGLSSTMILIIVWRGLQGIGAGMMMANAFTVIGDLFPPAERGKYQGLMSAVFGLSSIIGPTLGGFITDTISWHWVFFVNIPIGILIISLFIFFFPNIKPDTLKHQIDYWGLGTLILAVVPLMLALSWGGTEYLWNSPQIIGLFAFSMVMIALFLFVESRAKEPIIPLWLFTNRIMSISLVVSFLSAFGMFASITFVPLFFQGVLGATATTSGGFLTPMMLSNVAGSFISGQLLSRAGGHYRIQGIFGLGIMVIGVGLLSGMTPQTSYAQAIINVVITGFGLGIIMPLYTIAVQNASSYNVLGVSTSAAAFFRSVGGSVGLAIFGSVLNNRFATAFLNDLPAAVKAVVPADQLASMAHNPQVLVSVQAQTQLKDTLGPQGAGLFDQLLQVLRQSLSSAISKVFLVCLFIVIIAFVVNLFLKEIPLRKQHVLTSTSTNGKLKSSS